MKLFSSAIYIVSLSLAGCNQQSDTGEVSIETVSLSDLEVVISNVKANLVFVKGGDFLMGDFGVAHGLEGLPYDDDRNSKPLHAVEVSSFSIEKFKITNEAYRFYLASNEKPSRNPGYIESEWNQVRSAPTLPASISWDEAESYCRWLAKVTDLPFALPTEAQWEYAARSRGQYLPLATDDGYYRITDEPYREDWKGGPQGINYSTMRDRKDHAAKMRWSTGLYTPLPVDRFPPNAIGLYAMTDNGFEWVKDWYDPDYYKYSPAQNPQGPEKGVYKDYESHDSYAKVLRGSTYRDVGWIGGLNVKRSYRNPDGLRYGIWEKATRYYVVGLTARCVVNAEYPVL